LFRERTDVQAFPTERFDADHLAEGYWCDGDISPIDNPAPIDTLATREPEHAMNPTLSIPTEADWGDYRSDLDQESAHETFAGKSNAEMQQYFREIPIEAASDLRFMPETPFRYYMLGFRDCVMAGGFEPCHDCDAASCFIRLVAEKLETQPRYIVPIMPELLSAVEYVARNQTAFNAEESIYGSFPEILKEIQGLYANARDGNRGSSLSLNSNC